MQNHIIRAIWILSLANNRRSFNVSLVPGQSPQDTAGDLELHRTELTYYYPEGLQVVRTASKREK